MREPSAKKGKADLDTSLESGENATSTHSSRFGERNISRISHIEYEGMGIDQAILYSIDCCGMLMLFKHCL